jgi:hypothetical protein
MRKGPVGITCLLATLLATFMAGCGQEVATVPIVVSTIPANGATNVAVNTPISATFSIAMNPATLTAATFKVTGPGGANYLHGHDNHRGYGSGWRFSDRQLWVDFYDDYSAAYGDSHGAGEWGHRRSNHPGA